MCLLMALQLIIWPMIILEVFLIKLSKWVCFWGIFIIGLCFFLDFYVQR